MLYSVDLHMHSCLSPCADEDMTPNNMANMAMLNGLDIVALTDHNSYQNSEAFAKVAMQNNILPIYGMEVTTAEEIHVLAILEDFDKLKKLGDEVYQRLMDIENKPEIFGTQIIMDSEDNIISQVKKLLINATSFTSDDLIESVRTLGGVAIPAHIDRNSCSMLESFGMIPKEYNFKTLELSKNSDAYFFKKLHPELEDYRYISSSDAHYLEHIPQGDFKIELEEKSARCLIDYLKGGC